MRAFLFFKSLFGGLISKIFSDWRILAAIVIIAAGSIVLFKINNLDKNYKQAKSDLVQEKKNNDTLRGNVSLLVETNKSNGVVIDHVAKDRDRAVRSVTDLSESVAKTNSSINDLKDRINKLTVPPTPLTPYLVEALDGVQQLRDQENPPLVVTKKEAK